MEWIPVIVAIVSGAASVLAVVMSTRASNREITALLDKNQGVFEAKVTEQISQLRQQVEKHNNVIERVYKLETNDAVQDAELHRLGTRINIIETAGKGN